MDLLTIVAAEAAEHGESSKTLFYVAGGLLAAWAVALSGIGLSRPDFGTTAVAMRGVIAVTAVLVAAAMAAAVVTA